MSHFAGRIRVRDESLQSAPVMARAKEALLAMAGVESVEASQRVGSMLIYYQATASAAKQILHKLTDLFGLEEVGGTAKPERVATTISRAFLPKTRRIAKKIGMLVSLLVAVAAAVVDLKRLHILLGAVFLALLGEHLSARRQMLLR
ncbi:MAG: hypothetical protein AB1413_02045 [Thermodesulfobacteriota bacterium]